MNLWDVAEAVRRLRDAFGPMEPLMLVVPRELTQAETSALAQIGVVVRVDPHLAGDQAYVRPTREGLRR